MPRRSPAGRIVAKVFVLSAFAHALATGGGWLKLTSPHFELYTDAGEKTGREVLLRFEQIRHAFPQAEESIAFPVRVFVFRSEAEWRDYRPASSTLGYYQSAPERDYIAMQYSGPETFRIVFHEYAHLLLNHAGGPLPRWMEEGTAEYYSTIDFSKNVIQLGRPIPAHVETLRASRWLTAAELRDVNRSSPYYNEKEKAGIFYAQSWALVHMLRMNPAYAPAFERFAGLLSQGGRQEVAFERAFGKSMERAMEDLNVYARNRIFRVREIENSEAMRLTFVAHSVSETEASLVRADLLLSGDRPSLAEKIFQRLARENPNTVKAQTGLGTLALARRDYAAAQGYLEKAIALGSRDAATYLEYAMLLRDSGNNGPLVDKNLKKAVEIDPNFAEAQFLLGVRASNDDRYAEAVEHLLKATAIFPRQAYFWHALAYAYHQLGQTDNARRAAHRALDAAANAQEVAMAQAAIRLTETPLETLPSRRAP